MYWSTPNTGSKDSQRPSFGLESQSNYLSSVKRKVTPYREILVTVHPTCAAGDNEWEMFENKQYQGRSAVLRAGEYYDTSLLPFGNNDLSSVKMVGAVSANMAQTRKEMSHARGIGRWLLYIHVVEALVLGNCM